MVTNFEEATSLLYGLPNFSRQGNVAYKPGLQRIAALLGAMGEPQRHFPSVHVAGTNGKGSTASMIAAISTTAGRRVGLHTSPHLFHLCERLRIDGRPAPENWLLDAVQRYGASFAEVQASFFEAMVALSFLYFKEMEVDLAVVEVGMGGRFDATNILHPVVAVITRIGYDHTDVLGSTLREIASEKAGIIKHGVPVVCGLQEPEAHVVLQAIAAEVIAEFHAVHYEVSIELSKRHAEGSFFTLHTPVSTYTSLFLDLAGAHQVQNAVLAVRAAEILLGKDDAVPAIPPALKQVRRLSGLRGRLDLCRKEPLVVLDVGHNPEGLEAALTLMSETLKPGQGHLYVAFGAVRDKDIRSMARLLSVYRARVLVLPANTERTFSPDEIDRHLKDADVSVEIVENASDLLNRFYAKARKVDGLLITGSHYIASQFSELLI